MSEEKTKTPATDAGQAQVAAMFAEAAEKGYFGEVPDKTDPEEYTLRGQGKKLAARKAVADKSAK